MLNFNGLMTDAENLCTEVGDAIVNGNLAQAVKDALETRVTAVSAGVRALENALDGEGLDATLAAAASLTEAVGALAGEAAAAGLAVV